MRFGWLIALSILLVACETPDGNQNPSVSAGADITAAERTSVTLTGVVSDSDGSIAGLEWTLVSGPDVTLSATDTEEVTFMLPSLSEEATLTFRLTATDDEGATASADVSVTAELVQTDVVSIESNVYSNCAIAQDGSAKCWGYNDEFNLANGSQVDVTDASASLALIDFETRVPTYIKVGEYHGCALFDDQSVSCWGNKDYVGLDNPTLHDSAYVGDISQELGAGLPTINLGTGLVVKQLSVGNVHTCALLSNDRVKCWGDGFNGKLGYEALDFIGDQDGEMGDNLEFVDLGVDPETAQPWRVKRIEAGYELTCAILSNDRIKCWGENNQSQLGYGDFENRGDESGEMGDSLPFVDLGTNLTVDKLFVYYEHSCAVLNNGQLKCWGSNNTGEIGLGSGDSVIGNDEPANVLSQCNQSSDQAVFKKTVLSVGDAECPLGGYELNFGLDTGGDGIFSSGTTVHACHRHDVNILVSEPTEIAPGTSCSNGGLTFNYDYDADGNGEFDEGSNLMGDALPALDFGSSEPVIDMALGDEYSCALLADGVIKCWGTASAGQLGSDSSVSWGRNDGETPANHADVNLGEGLLAVAISGSYEYNCALLDNGKVKCWGTGNGYGPLGVSAYFGETIGDGDPAAEMGDNLQYLNLFRDTP